MIRVRREPRNLRDIRGPSTEGTEFTEGKFGIVVSKNLLGAISLLYKTSRRQWQLEVKKEIPSCNFKKVI